MPLNARQKAILGQWQLATPGYDTCSIPNADKLSTAADVGERADTLSQEGCQNSNKRSSDELRIEYRLMTNYTQRLAVTVCGTVCNRGGTCR
jgi:hypothetical protein